MKFKNFIFAYLLFSFTACNPQNTHMTHQHTNELIHESSPYLLQHAHNPVDWFPWNSKAWGKAKAEDKLVIVSIGYSACHWCHVMEHESFEDSLVAKIMNDNFVSIKVDREERPDIDQIYMDAVQLITGHGGWPLNAVCLPDGRPVYAGTYFRKEQWQQVLLYLVDEYKNRKTESLKRAEGITQGIISMDAISVVNDASFSKDSLNTIWSKYALVWDFEYGGRRGAPKFPMPANLNYMLDFALLTKNEQALKAVTLTLDKMLEGGIYDHAGGGFARYSVDEFWHIPHFEKMLYDNAQLISLYAKAYNATLEPQYKTAAYRTLQFLDRELKHSDGYYFSALDADSEGEEGKFYVWKLNELKQIIGNDFDAFCNAFDVSEVGNFEGANNLVRKKIEGFGSEQEQIWMNKLLHERSKKIRPGLDDKSLTSWNALLQEAFANAYLSFGDEIWLQHAKDLNMVLHKNVVTKEGLIYRNYKNGKATIPGFLEDYALMIDALIALYFASSDESYLNEAKKTTDFTIQHFFDSKDNLFYFTSIDDEPLIARKKETTDNVIPASNSVIAHNLFQLGTIFDESFYSKMSLQMTKNMQQFAQQHTNFYSNWARLELKYLFPVYEVAIVGKDAKKLKAALLKSSIPNVLILASEKESNLPLLQSKYKEDETWIYVCVNKSCQLPVKTVEEALKQIKH